MRSLLGASDTAIALAMVCAACTTPAAPRPPLERGKPTPTVLVVGLDQLALRTTAWVELHAWLAAAARSSAELPDPELDGAARAYREALADDDRDDTLTRTARALETCEDERCARAAVTGTRFAQAYLSALPAFLARHWTERATVTRAGIEVARAALGAEVEPILKRLAQDLAIDWPSAPVAVDIVGDAPAPARDAPIRMLLATQGSCFAGASQEATSVRDARITDCVIAYALLRLDHRSALATALTAELRATGGGEDAARAWTALVVHAVATTVTGIEPKHTSAMRRSAAAAMPREMAWLAAEWPSRMHGEPAAAFAKRYASALRER